MLPTTSTRKAYHALSPTTVIARTGRCRSAKDAEAPAAADGPAPPSPGTVEEKSMKPVEAPQPPGPRRPAHRQFPTSAPASDLQQAAASRTSRLPAEGTSTVTCTYEFTDRRRVAAAVGARALAAELEHHHLRWSAGVLVAASTPHGVHGLSAPHEDRVTLPGRGGRRWPWRSVPLREMLEESSMKCCPAGTGWARRPR